MQDFKKMQIGKIFDLIAEKENVQFELNKSYVPKTKFEIETPEGFKKVTAMIVKEDEIIELTTDKGILKLAKDHKIVTADGKEVKVKNLKVQDELYNVNGNAKILEIKKLPKEKVYDISVEGSDSLYLDSLGFKHHNTFHVTKKLQEILGPDGDKWHYHSGAKTAPFSFYKTVFMEKDDIIVWDEADSLLKNDDIIMMLKPALDTSGKHYFEYTSGTQNVSYYSEDEIDEIANNVRNEILGGAIITASPKGKGVQLPSKFKFTGSMIFISNMRANKIEQAIMSRSLFIDVYLAERDVLKRIQMIGERKFGKDEAMEILEALGGVPAETFNNNDNLETADSDIVYMTPEFARKNKPITVRSMEVAKALKDSGLSNWATLAAMYG